MRPGVWARWLAAAGAWQGWTVCPALLAPEADEITPVSEPQTDADRLATRLAQDLDGGVLLLLELNPVLGVRVAARLNERRLANAVIVLPRWPYQCAILPVDGLLHSLVSESRRLRQGAQMPNVVFVCDSQRARPVRHRPASDVRADNRYRLLVSDLPDLAALRARGIRRMAKISRG